MRRSARVTCVLLLTSVAIWAQSLTSSQLILNQGSRVFYSNPTPRWPEADVFIGADTVAEVLSDGDSVSCRLTVIKEEFEREILRKAFPTMTDVGTNNMLKLVESCGQAEQRPAAPTGWNAQTLLMYPGTLWCGPGDVAANYSELGEFEDVDRCCRNHDFCPLKIYGGRTRFGLRPDYFKAAMLCQCETAFDECLRRVEESNNPADSIRYYYFKFYSPQCILQAQDGTPSLVDFEVFNETVRRTS